MSGPNEHHIPRFFQRAFAVKRKGGEPNEIWEYRKGAGPRLLSISQTGSEEHFYGAELDAKLKVPENALGSHFATLRKQPIGAAVDGALAADLVNHLAPRARHIRAAMETAVQQFMMETDALLADPERLETMLGLDGDTPDERFIERMWEALGRVRPDIDAAGLPRELLNRVGFALAREQFDSNVMTSASAMSAMLDNFGGEATHAVRDGHNRALESGGDGNALRRDILAGFHWTIEPAPDDGAILPDCVALAFSPAETLLPLMFVGAEIEAAVMPLTKDRLLVGRPPDKPVPDVAAFNIEAAACCEEFFLADRNDEALHALAARIGERSSRYFGSAIDEVMNEHAPRRAADAIASDAVGAVDHLALTDADRTISYGVQPADFGDDELAQRLAAAIQPVIAGFAAALPLSRLDGVSFAVDFYGVLQSVQNGEEYVPAERDEGQGGVGLMGAVAIILPEGRPAGRIVLSVLVADYLLRETDEEIAYGRRVLVHQLMLVAIMELLDRSFPGSLLRFPIADELDAWLFPHSVDARSAYSAARMAGAFGEGLELSAYYRAALVGALGELKAASEAERRVFLQGQDADRLADAIFPMAAAPLYFAAALLGHCEATNEDIVGPGDELAHALEDLGLRFWLAEYGKNLKAFHLRLGRWTSEAELVRFSRHVERMLWSVGIFPWKSSEGLRIETLIP